MTNKPIITGKPTAKPKITEKPIITNYVIHGNVLDADGDIVSSTGRYTISVKSIKLSKTTIKKGNACKRFKTRRIAFSSSFC